LWIFGKVEKSEVHYADDKKVAGFMELEKARVRWFLSLDKADVPGEALQKGDSTYRSVTVNGEEGEFSGGFTDLHTIVYQNILSGNGFGIDDARPSVDLAYQIRNTNPSGVKREFSHPLLSKIRKII